MALESQTEAIALLALSVLVICTFILTASGLFPSEIPISQRFGHIGAIGVYLALAVIFLLVLHVAAFAVEHAAWYFAIITAGLALLASPWIHALLPPTIRDGAAGLFILGACGAVMHFALFAL